MSHIPPIGRIMDAGRKLCSYSPGDTAATDCDAPATWHIAWNADLDAGFACCEHITLVQRRFVYLDRHPMGSDCGMPNALWFFEEKRCGYPEADTPELVRAHSVALTQ